MGNIINPYRYESSGGGGTGLLTGCIGCWEKDETSGVIAFDETPNAQSGDIISPTSINQTGKINKAYQYTTATTSQVHFSDNSFLHQLGAMTISTWVYPYDTSTIGARSKGILSSWYTNRHTILRFRQSRLEWYLRANGTTAGTTFMSNVPNNAWYHICARWNGSLMTMYVNNILQPTTLARNGPLGDNTNIYQWFIGIYKTTASSSNTYCFDGLIDQTVIWNRELPSVEIGTLNNNGNGLAYNLW